MGWGEFLLFRAVSKGSGKWRVASGASSGVPWAFKCISQNIERKKRFAQDLLKSGKSNTVKISMCI